MEPYLLHLLLPVFSDKWDRFSYHGGVELRRGADPLPPKPPRVTPMALPVRLDGLFRMLEEPEAVPGSIVRRARQPGTLVGYRLAF